MREEFGFRFFEPGETYIPVSEVAGEVFPRRRDLDEELPPAPPDLDFAYLPRSIADVARLLPPGLAAKFREELENAKLQILSDLVMEWGGYALILHDDRVQGLIEEWDERD